MNSRFLNLNWGQTLDERSHLDTNLSSIMPPVGAADSLALHKLFGDEPHYTGSSLNSLPKLHLSLLGDLQQSHQPAMGAGLQLPLAFLEQFAGDAGHPDRAVRFSDFHGRTYGQMEDRERLFPGGIQPEVFSGDAINAGEERSVSDPASGSNTKKRKASQKCKGKDTVSPKVEEDEDSTAKRFRQEIGTENEIIKPKMEQNDVDGGQKQSKEKPPEPPKDYIHVRARRGQATDSHSLAERVRREKISQRMKLLQDLVPGCSKVTGKAVMLDEIINYVQSLQRQVEFLSMKLATVNPRLDFNNLATLFNKDLSGPIPNSVYPVESSGMASSSYGNQPQQGSSLNSILNSMETQSSLNLLDAAFQQNFSTHQSFCDGLGSSSSQLENFWGDDLQNGFQMDIGQSPDTASLNFPGPFPTAHRKIEL